jgi:hypothetical protein
MQVTSDPQELRRMIGVRTVAEVYRTLDKLQLRKEYHKALEEHGVSFDFIVKNMKDVVMSAEKDADKINALKTILKSLGMDKYDGEADQGTNSWEESLLKAAEEKKAISPGGIDLDADYEVRPPEVPENVQEMMDNEQKFSKSLYED